MHASAQLQSSASQDTAAKENTSAHSVQEERAETLHKHLAGHKHSFHNTRKLFDDETNSVDTIERTPGLSFSLNQIPVHRNSSLFVQPKLSVNASGDEYEQEADAVADEVMRMHHGPVVQQTPFLSSIQRKCETCGKEEEEATPITVQRKCANCEEEEKGLQRQATENSSPGKSTIIAQALQSPGQPLNQTTRSFMEQRFGYDFSNVVIHNDQLAHSSSAAINAQAYTHGTHIVFGNGQFQPGDFTGKKLLAHELAHVVQQTGERNESPVVERANQHQSLSGHIAPTISVNAKLTVNTPGDIYEQEADVIADKVMDTQPSLQHDKIEAGYPALQSVPGRMEETDSSEHTVDQLAKQKLLSHELTHVTGQQSIAPNVMRSGRTFGGFFANIFKFWDYSREDLNAYLKTIVETDQIQDDDNSDDKARQIVKEWKTNKTSYDLKPRTRVLMVREMLDGVVFGSDQDAIIDLLEGSTNSDLVQMFNVSLKGLTFSEIHSKLGGAKKRLELFNERVLSTLDQYKAPDPKDAKSIEGRLGDVEKEHGIEFKDFSVSFQLASGPYFKSFFVDAVVPEGGITVTITLTRTSLKVRLQPALFIDVIWPVRNAELSGFTLTFAGLKTQLDMEGLNLVTGTAHNKVRELLLGLLAGTRFEQPTYDPTKDPDLISELADNQIIGDINRVKYNLEKNGSKKEEGDSEVPQHISGLSYDFNLVHKVGIPVPDSGYGVSIPPGTNFNLYMTTSGTAAELMKKNSRLEKIRITCDGIFVYKDKVKVVGLTSIQIDRGLNFKLGGVKAFVDLKELAKQESPGWAKGAVGKVTGLMDSYDKAVDTVDAILTLGGLLGPRAPKSDVAKDVAVSLAEKLMGWVVEGMLLQHWKKIKSATGVSDKQMEQFFGVEAFGDADEEE